MKLYLSSQKLGNFPDMLLKIVGQNKNVVVIANAIDDKSEEYRTIRVNREIKMLKKLGLNAEELDLRNFFNKKNEIYHLLKTKSLVWIRGGNTFILRRAMIESGFDEAIISLLQENKIVYGGYSAALLAVGKDLKGVDIVDDPNIIPEGYPNVDINNKSLKLFDFQIIPHFGSNDEWAINVNKHIEYMNSNNEKYITLSDGEIYYSDGEMEMILR